MQNVHAMGNKTEKFVPVSDFIQKPRKRNVAFFFVAHVAGQVHTECEYLFANLCTIRFVLACELCEHSYSQ